MPALPVPAMLANTDGLFQMAKEGAEPYLQASPFEHYLLSELVKLQCVNPLFEAISSVADEVEFVERLERDTLPDVIRMLIWELSSSTLIRHFSSLTDTPPLLPDPYFFRSGIGVLHETTENRSSQLDGFDRHPKTDLENALRLEMFVSKQKAQTLRVEYLNAEQEAVASEEISPGSALVVNARNYALRYVTDEPENWVSFVAFYFINDKARVLNGEHQPSAY